MYYSLLRRMDVSNGEGLGVSVFVSGCRFHCKDCFNPEAWDFSHGKEWTEESLAQLLSLLENEHIKRVSVLGGEPLCDENAKTVCDILSAVKAKHPELRIWLYTGYEARISFAAPRLEAGAIYDEGGALKEFLKKISVGCFFDFEPRGSDPVSGLWRSFAAGMSDVIVDGRFETERKNLKLKFRGSDNQRVIDAAESLRQEKIVFYCD